MVNTRYFTWFNFVAIFFLSLGIYICYVWASNYTGFSSTYASMHTIFNSPHYYLTIGLCVVLCYAFDIFFVSYGFEFRTGPVDLLRKLINQGKPLDEHEVEFDKLYNDVKLKAIQEDL